MESVTRFVLRRRWFVLAAWIGVLVLSMAAASGLSDLLTNRFTLPGTDTEKAENVLKDHFGQRSTGSFTLVVRADGSARELVPQVRAAAQCASRELPTSHVASVGPASDDVVVANIVSDLEPADAKGHTDDMRAAIGTIPGAQDWLTGQAATEHDLDPVFSEDLTRGELIAIPFALLLLIFVFGTLAFLLPFAFALFTIPTTLGIVWIFANFMELTTYLTNLVSLIGIGIALDYSLLIVYRFREELSRTWPAAAPAGQSPAPPPPDAAAGTPPSGAGHSTVPSGAAPAAASQERETLMWAKNDAIVRTMATAGRAVVFSGTAVAIGLSLLLFMPLPFMRGFGIGGLIIPTVSVLAAVTLLPVLLSLIGQPLDRVRILPKRMLEKRVSHQYGFWPRLARAIMRRPALVAVSTASALVLLALPVLALQLGPGSNTGIPRHLEAVRGLDELSAAVGAGATAPTNVVVDTGRTGGATDGEVRAAVGRLETSLRGDPQVAAVRFAPGSRQHVDPTGRYLNIEVIGRQDYGTPDSLDFVTRLRDGLIPAAGFPPAAEVFAGGGPPGGKDFLDLTYGWFPWLVLAVLAATYVLLLRAFRSLLLPLKAIVLNLLSIGAAYGLLVAVFKWGGGEWAGLISYDQIEGWIPVMLFAMLFGLSMDYEVFLVSRMREEWDNGGNNEDAVVEGLSATGRLVTAAGLIMFAAFMGFVAGSIVGLQQFGFGLAAAILIDVTIVRALLVPSAMKLFGRWNWWLPHGVARVFRVKPSPLGQHRPAIRPAGR